MLTNILTRVDFLVFKDKSGSDAAQVPLSGAAITLCKVGAVVKTATTLHGTNTVPTPNPEQEVEV